MRKQDHELRQQFGHCLGGRIRTDKMYKKHNKFGNHVPNTGVVGFRIKRLKTNHIGCWRQAGIVLQWSE